MPSKREPLSKRSKGKRLPVETKIADPARDGTPTLIDNHLQRLVGLAEPTRVPGAGRPAS